MKKTLFIIMDTFRDKLKAIEDKGLIKENFEELLIIVEKTRGWRKKYDAFATLILHIKSKQRVQILDPYKSRIEAICSKILMKIEETSYEIIRRYLFTNMVALIKMANLLNQLYPQIKNIFSKILSEFIEKANGYSDRFVNAFLSIQDTDLIKDNFSELLIAMGKVSVNRSYDRFGMFSVLISSIKDANLMDKYSSQIETSFSNLLDTVETLQDYQSKRNAFRILIVTSVGTNLVHKFSSQIETTFSNLLSEVESKSNDLNKIYEFFALFGPIRTLRFHKLRKFKSILVVIKETDLLEQFFSRIENLISKVLKVIEKMPDDERKQRTLRKLEELITGTELINRFGSKINLILSNLNVT
jgi:hypothetical protein